MSKRRKLVIWSPTPDLQSQANDHVEKLALSAQEAIDELHARIDALPQGQGQPSQPISPSFPPVTPSPFQQKWYNRDILLAPDVREVHIDEDLLLTRFGQYGVRVAHIPTGSGNTFVLARFGCWVTHDFTPMGSGKQKFRYECNFIYVNGGSDAILLEWGTVDDDAHKLRIVANTNTHTTWTLDAYGNNTITFPAPASGAHKIIVEFDGTNVGTGIAQWNVWVDGVLQTLTVVNDNNTSGLNDALFYSSGASYTDPTAGTPALKIFPGAIWMDRLFDDVTGDLTEPSYIHLKMWSDARDIMQSSYTENYRATITQGSPDPGAVPGATGNISAWLLALTTNFAFSCENGAVHDQLYSKLTDRTTGFPGQFKVRSLLVDLAGDTVECILNTPNVLRVPNRADMSDEQKWSLFHSPLGQDITDATDRWFRTLANYTAPETF